MNIRQTCVLFARIALFVIYFWFGLLKVIGMSPASPMVASLFSKTIGPMMPTLSFNLFIILFGLFEMLVGILFIIPGLEKTAVILFCLHMITTTLPIFVMGKEIWVHPFVPTLEGQYIIKNLALLVCVLTIWAAMPPKKEIYG